MVADLSDCEGHFKVHSVLVYVLWLCLDEKRWSLISSASEAEKTWALIVGMFRYCCKKETSFNWMKCLPLTFCTVVINSSASTIFYLSVVYSSGCCLRSCEHYFPEFYEPQTKQLSSLHISLFSYGIEYGQYLKLGQFWWKAFLIP